MDVLPYSARCSRSCPRFLRLWQRPGDCGVVFAGALLYEDSKAASWCARVRPARCGCRRAVVFLSLIVGAVLGGIVGALLALPLARGDCDVDRPTARGSPGETEQPQDVETRRKDEQQEQEYEQRTEEKPAAKAAAIAVEIANERNRRKTTKTTPSRQTAVAGRSRPGSGLFTGLSLGRPPAQTPPAEEPASGQDRDQFRSLAACSDNEEASTYISARQPVLWFPAQRLPRFPT